MANEPVTEVRLIAILKDFRNEIREDMDRQRKEMKHDVDKQTKNITNDFLEALAEYNIGAIKPALDELNSKVDSLIDRVEKVGQEINWLKRDLKDIKAEFSTSASIKQHSQLKAKILSLQEELNEIKQRIGLTN